jgi:hypothetical protein
MQILTALLGISLVPENLVVEAVHLFADFKDELSPVAIEIQDLRLPRRGTKECECTEVQGKNYLPFIYPPNLKILEIIEENKTDEEPEFFIRHFFLNLRITFATDQILNNFED